MATDQYEDDMDLDEEIVDDEDLSIDVIDDTDDVDDVDYDGFDDAADEVVDEDDDTDDEDDDADAEADADDADDAESDDTSDDDDDVDLDDEEDEEDEETLEVLLGPDGDAAPTPQRTRTDDGGDAPPGEGEFTCRSCFLVKRRAQLADADAMICLDCA